MKLKNVLNQSCVWMLFDELRIFDLTGDPFWFNNDGKWFQHGAGGFFWTPPFPLSSHFLALDDISRGLVKDAFTFKYLTASLTSFNLLDDVNGSSLSLKFEKRGRSFHLLGNVKRGHTVRFNARRKKEGLRMKWTENGKKERILKLAGSVFLLTVISGFELWEQMTSTIDVCFFFFFFFLIRVMAQANQVLQKGKTDLEWITISYSLWNRRTILEGREVFGSTYDAKHFSM